MVRQFRHHGFKAMVAVGLQQVHHGLAPVAAFAVHVLEQVQRVRAVAVEGGDVGFLQRDQGLAAQPGGQGFQRLAGPGVLGQRGVDLGKASSSSCSG